MKSAVGYAPRVVEAMPHPQNHDSVVLRWVKDGLTARTVFTIVSIVAGFIATHARDEARLDQIGADIKEIKSQYVPRSEHVRNDEWLQRTLETLNERVSNIERILLERGNDR